MLLRHDAAVPCKRSCVLVGAIVAFGCGNGDSGTAVADDDAPQSDGRFVDVLDEVLADYDAGHEYFGEGAENNSCYDLDDNCGPASNDDCCVSPAVAGGTFYRDYDGVRNLDQTYQATVRDFRLDKYEVTVNRYNNFLEAWTDGWRPAEGAGKHAHLNGGRGLSNRTEPPFERGWDPTWASNVTGQREWALIDLGNEPVRGLNWFEACAFCIWDGGFLPSDAEWNYSAAGGAEHRLYPWGVESLTPERGFYCHLLPPHGYPPTYSEACSSRAPVGTHPAGDGRWGHADLVGSASEWVLDAPWDGATEPLPIAGASPLAPTTGRYATPCMDCTYSPALTQSRIVRGYVGTAYSRPHTPAQRTAWDPTRRAAGVRCARPPVPFP